MRNKTKIFLIIFLLLIFGFKNKNTKIRKIYYLDATGWLYKNNLISREEQVVFKPYWKREEENNNKIKKYADMYDFDLLGDTEIVFSIDNADTLFEQTLVKCKLTDLYNIKNWEILKTYSATVSKISISPDNKKLIYCVSEAGFINFLKPDSLGDLYLYDLKLKTHKLIASKNVITENFDWEPNSQFFSYTTYENGLQISNIYDIKKQRIIKKIKNAKFVRWYKTKKNTFFYYNIQTKIFNDYNLISNNENKSKFSDDILKKLNEFDLLLVLSIKLLDNDKGILFLLPNTNFFYKIRYTFTNNEEVILNFYDFGTNKTKKLINFYVPRDYKIITKF